MEGDQLLVLDPTKGCNSNQLSTVFFMALEIGNRRVDRES